ncbi:MAG: HsdR family type I site-specific deoxyribonuclease [Methanoregula sp.]|nr:HsdR family type I site-specific deoxyribonuclease [Methanoregula sp.]
MITRIALNEKEYVEEPFLRQLERLGWKILRAGDEGKGDPAVTFREGFHEVLIEKALQQALKRINPWLAEDQIAPIIRELTNLSITGGLVEKNRFILEKLLENTSAENKITRQPETVRFIDFSNPEKNEFLAISQYKVTIPGTEKHIIPDIILFINGIPIGVVECKSAYLADPIGEAVTQLTRYQNRRGDEKEGNEKLFWYNQLVIATSKQVCKYTSITGEFEHFNEWKDPYPYSLHDIDTEGSESVTSQHVLIQGILDKKTLLDIIQSYIVFQEDAKGKMIKLLPRYQQYRTVCKIIERLKTQKNPKEKGGIVWHTQGSGKSLTMMMAVRRMYRDRNLSGYKTVFVTDRTDLERQLKDTARSIGYTINVANTISKLKDLLRTNTPDIVMGMIHKFQEHEIMQEFPVLNMGEKILIMIDEAHRTQYKYLGANLLKSLPNAVRIAFTGTPIDKTEKTFGNYIDKYSIRQAVKDGVTVEIIYEGRTHTAEIADRDAMNQRFRDVFAAANEEDQHKILKKYAWKAYLEAEETIREKAEDMLKHYLAHIYPNGFKAQVVAVSRVAAIRYKQSFDALLADENWIEAYIQTLKNDTQIKISRENLKKLRAEVVISGTANDPPEMHRFTEETNHEKIIRGFKLPFGKTGENGESGDIGIIIVQSMLLTGFDAPLEQVMYLDDIIRDHSLLQAIARVNRIERNKSAGFIIDYAGVTNHLRKALSEFEEKDVAEVLQVFKDDARDLDELAYSKAKIEEFFKKFDIRDINDTDACVDVLADEEARNDFLALYKEFTTAMDRALPKPEALKFAQALKQVTFISQVARNRYRDEKFSIKDASKKIRDIVDEYLISHGVDPKIPPVPIFSEKFKMRLRQQQSPRAQSEEMMHAIGEHISRHAHEDPELYEKFGEMLEKLLQEYQHNWELLAKELEALLDEIRRGREAEENFGFDRKTEMPFLGLLKKEVFGVKNLSELEKKELELLIETTKDLSERLKTDTQMVDFWNNITAQKRLKSYIASHLLTVFKDKPEFFVKRAAISQKILELAFHIYGEH